MKKFSKFEIATIKRTAQNVNPMMTKKKKLLAKIEELKAEFMALDDMQQQYEAAIKNMTGGYSTEDLVIKVDSVIEEGKVITPAKFILKYPETVIPVEPMNTVCTNTGVESYDSPVEEEPVNYMAD